MYRPVTSSLIVAIFLVIVASPVWAASPVNTTLFGNAIDGFDPVAYHTEGKPTEGSRAFTHEWMGATWRFANAAHRDLFASDPTKYAPAYGGYCAYGVSQGAKIDVDPEAWRIVDGKLYLNKNKSVQRIWLQDIPGYIVLADTKWPSLKDN